MVTWPLYDSEAGSNLFHVNAPSLHNKNSEVCIKTKSPPDLLPFKGQVTEQTTVNGLLGNYVQALNDQKNIKKLIVKT